MDTISFGGNTHQSDTLAFTIKPTTAPFIPLWEIVLIVLAVIGMSGAVYYVSRKK